jgi:hypothetical protein
VPDFLYQRVAPGEDGKGKKSKNDTFDHGRTIPQDGGGEDAEGRAVAPGASGRGERIRELSRHDEAGALALDHHDLRAFAPLRHDHTLGQALGTAGLGHRLQHDGTYFILRQSHELCGDLDLAFNVIRQSLCRDNRLLEDGGFDSGHAPVPALG